MSDINWCTAEAQDDPRFAYTESTFAPPPGVWAPDCGHPKCVEDDENCPNYGPGNGHYWDCPMAECRHGIAHSACEFEAGHEGDHSYALPATSEAVLRPYDAPTLNVVLIQVIGDHPAMPPGMDGP